MKTTRILAAALFIAGLAACSKDAPVEATPPTPPVGTEAPAPAAAEAAKEADDLAKEIEADLADEG